MEFLNVTFYGNTLGTWGAALLAALGTLIALRLVERFVIRRLMALVGRTTSTWDDLVAHALGRTKLLFLLIVAVYAGSLLLALPDRVRGILGSVAVIALLVQGGVWGSAGLAFWLERYRQRQLAADPAAVTTMSALGFVGKLVLWSVVLLLALDNMGVQVTALMAGLGVGGIAVALAAQNILGDLFASLSIVLDKPFVIGDFLIVGEHRGNVENIGLKTTRIRSLSGEQLVFSNTDLLGSRIRNFGRMYQRRVDFKIGVTYQTPREQLRLIPGIIREAVEAQPKTRFDRSHFMAYGDFALVFESVYFVLDPAYNTYMDIHQAVNLHIHERFEAEGIEFAYPTQTLYVIPQGSPAGV